MTREEVHDVGNIVAPALSLTQNLVLGYYGEVPPDQKEILIKIERCLKNLQRYLYKQAAPEKGTK